MLYLSCLLFEMLFREGTTLIFLAYTNFTYNDERIKHYYCPWVQIGYINLLASILCRSMCVFHGLNLIAHSYLLYTFELAQACTSQF